MSTDRELLELAAKAIGLEIKPMEVKNVTAQEDDRFIGYLTKPEQWPRGWFDPLTDDGDALRLLAAMPSLWSLSLKFGAPTVEMNVAWGAGGEKAAKIAREFAGDGADVAAAIRRAIVRAAAEVGKVLP